MWGNLQEGIEGLERLTPELCREWRDGGIDYARLTANGFSHKKIEALRDFDCSGLKE